jgi:hypothetical protein
MIRQQNRDVKRRRGGFGEAECDGSFRHRTAAFSGDTFTARQVADAHLERVRFRVDRSGRRSGLD